MAYSIITPLQWEWRTDDRVALGAGFVRPKLIEGLNTIRILPKDSPPPGNDVLMDIVVVSTVEFRPADQQYRRAQVAVHLAVEPADELATAWGRIKQAF